MRIKELLICKHKNIENMKISFDQKNDVNIIIGKNASAKSNLLEAIVLIYRNLDLSEAPPFKYHIRYECRNREIVIDADPERKTRRYRISVNGENVSLTNFSNEPNREFLPSTVFGYYSGISRRFKDHFDKHQDIFDKQLRDNIPAPLRPLFYARTVHSQYVLLAFFSFRNEAIPMFLSEFFGITDFVDATFILKRPKWYNPINKDDRFWGAIGVVRDFLDDLYENSSLPVKSEKDGKIYLRLENIDELRSFAKKYGDNVNFFKTLESTYIADLIDELIIRVKKGNTIIEYTDLSEGEQQLLAVLGLLRFTNERESLFLLDEPDTYLHPAWKLKYVSMINDTVGKDATSQIVVVTHDPLTISGLKKSQINILHFDSKSNKLVAKNPEKDPIGMSSSGLLRSELFGLTSDLDYYTQQILDRKRYFIVQEKLDEAEKKELSEIDDELDKMGFMFMFRDDLYTTFIKELSNYESETDIIFNDEEKSLQKEITKKIIKKISEKK